MRVPHTIVALVASLFVAAGCTKRSAPPAPVTPEPAQPTEDPAPAPAPIVLPASFEADRIFLELRTDDGQTLRLFTDTGGGLYIERAAVQRLGLTVGEARVDDGPPMLLASLPELDATTPLPSVPLHEGHLPISELDPHGQVFGDGVLGEGWFRGRVWTFDYAQRTLMMHSATVECDHDPVALGFLVDDTGERKASYPRISIEIDESPHDLLFSTGATALLTAAGRAGLDDGGPDARATSYIVRSVFDRWRERHPDWQVIEAADRMAEDPMIEVPAVRIGGHTVGPVWFTARADPHFHQQTSQWMDRRVDGALGGSALRYFRVTVDYPAATACFEPT